MTEELNEVYNKVDALFKIKIKTQIKGSGLIFNKILFVKDLLDDSECYHLVINKKVFGFSSTNEFYYGFLKIVRVFSKENQLEIDYYEEHKSNDLLPDIMFIDEALEELYDKDYKYKKLEIRLQKLLE
ncbi:hypothetical protein [Pedobacter panaciterrae]